LYRNKINALNLTIVVSLIVVVLLLVSLIIFISLIVFVLRHNITSQIKYLQKAAKLNQLKFGCCFY